MDDSTFDHETGPANPLLSLAGPGSADVSPLEQEVLDEYSRLLENMNKLHGILSALAGGPMTTEIVDGLRLLERRVTSVYTLWKASVYSIVLQQGQMEGESETEGNTTVGRGMGDGMGDMR